MTATESAMIVRDAASSDASTIVEFNLALALESEQRRLDPRVVRLGVEAVLADAARGRYFIAEMQGAIVGQTMLTYEWSDWRNGTFWWIQSVYVRADARGRGVFRALFEHVERLARAESDVCGLRLYVETHNEPALATYRRLGMVPSGHVLYELDWSQQRA